MERYIIEENGITLVFEVTDEKDVRFLHFSSLPFDECTLADEKDRYAYRMFEFQATGFGRGENHGLRYMQNKPGIDMTYVNHTTTTNEQGKRLDIVMEHQPSGLLVRSVFQFYSGLSLTRCWKEIENVGNEPQGLEYISSFALTGISKEGIKPDEEKLLMHIPYNGWEAEVQWLTSTLPELGFHHLADAGNSCTRIQRTNVGSWSSGETLPMACLENTETSSMLFWQIETSGGWHWEISDMVGELVLNISGPSEIEHHWWKNLAPGETFIGVPICIGSVIGGINEAMRELTRYRRRIRRPNADNENLPVIFNDYMNCLWGNPTTEKELPMIDAAAEIGCEYYVVDAGWYADGEWWDAVGEWLPSQVRFPGGFTEVMDHIHAKGMIPGVWLEIEVMGIHSPKLKDTDDSWFFMRHGKRIIDRDRYQLDFTNPKVRDFAASVIDRVVNEYGVGYIKMDYNINGGVGTEQGSDSFGDGLLKHTRAYQAWLDQIFATYPDLVIENCSSGGMRMDYSMLSRYSIQSTSDQTDYLKYAVIASNAPTALAPEQSAIWSYPLKTSTREDIIFNSVNALLMRIHQSGDTSQLTDDNRALVAEGIAYYKSIRHNIKRAIPFWPLGVSHQGAEWVSLGLDVGTKLYIAVWRIHSTKNVITLKVPQIKGKDASISCRFPATDQQLRWSASPVDGTISIELPNDIMARIIEIDLPQTEA
ncbi:MAG: alpha-galactosidase [Clostridiales bacterium]|nr:alpha-galactosidase [Clostridiales bacterium]